MKKILLLLLTFLFIGTVKANELNTIDLIWEDVGVGEVTNVEKVSDGYYVYGNNGIYHFYNQVSNYVKKYPIENLYYYKVEGDQIYLFIFDDNGMNFVLINKDFEELKRGYIELGNVTYYKKTNDGFIFFGNSNGRIAYYKVDKNFQVTDFTDYPIYSWTYLGAKDNDTLYFRTNSPIHWYKYDGEFSEVTYAEVEPAESAHYNFYYDTVKNSFYNEPPYSEETYNRIVAREQPTHSNTSMDALIVPDEDNYVVLYQEYANGWSEDELIVKYGFKLAYLDKNLNEKWHVDFPDIPTNYDPCDNYPHVGTHVTVSGDNIILLSNYSDHQIFNVYNKQGELSNHFEDKIKEPIELMPIYTDLEGEHLFTVYQSTINICASKTQPKKSYMPTLLAYNYDDLLDHPQSKVSFYAVTYKINTKVVSGKGTIKISSSSAASGEEVVFEIEPEDGYVLGEVRVTDSAGNVIVFTDYKFTMPSSDVTIEVTFIKQSANPNTGDLAITILILIAMAIGSLALVQKKKLNELK